MILSRGYISFKYVSVPMRINFFFALVMATFSLLRSFNSIPFSGVYLVHEMITISQSIPWALSIVITLTLYIFKWAVSKVHWSTKGVMIVMDFESTPQCLKLSIIIAHTAASIKFLYLLLCLSLSLRFIMILSVFKKVTLCFFISSSQVSIEFTSLGKTTFYADTLGSPCYITPWYIMLLDNSSISWFIRYYFFSTVAHLAFCLHNFSKSESPIPFLLERSLLTNGFN